MVDRIAPDQIVGLDEPRKPAIQPEDFEARIQPDQIIDYQPKDPIGSKADNYRLDEDQTIIKPDERSFFKRISDRLLRPSYSPAKSAAIMTLQQKTGAPIDVIEKNYDKIEHEIFGGMAPTDEIINDVGTVGLLGALLYSPVSTLTGVASFLGVNEIKDYVVTKAKNEDYSTAGTAHVSELLPEHYPKRVKTATDILEFVGIAMASGGIAGVGQKHLQGSTWWRSMTNKERGLETLRAANIAKRSGQSTGQIIRNRLKEKGGHGSKEGDVYFSKMQDVYSRGPKAQAELLSEDVIISKTFQNIPAAKRTTVYNTIFKKLSKKEQTRVLQKHKDATGLNFTRKPRTTADIDNPPVAPFQVEATSAMVEALKFDAVANPESASAVQALRTEMFTDSEVSSLMDMGVRYRTMDAMLTNAAKAKTKKDRRDVKVWNEFISEHIATKDMKATAFEKSLTEQSTKAVFELTNKFDEFIRGVRDSEGKIIPSKLSQRKSETLRSIQSELEVIHRDATLANKSVSEYLVENGMASVSQAGLVETYIDRVLADGLPKQEGLPAGIKVKADTGPVFEMLKKSREEMQKAKKIKWHDVTKEIQRGITARDVIVRDTLEGIPGAAARTALSEKILAAGAGSAADSYYKKVYPKIWGTLNSKERTALDDMIFLRKELAIAERQPGRRPVEGITHPAQYEAALAELRNVHGLSEERFNVVLQTAKTYQDTMQDMLNKKLVNNAISNELYQILKDNFYSPTEWLRAYDLYNEALAAGSIRNVARPLTTIDEIEDYLQRETGSRAGNLQSKTSGVKRLKGGMKGYQNLDSQELLVGVVNETYNWVAKNNATRSLASLADDLPKNHGSIRKAKISNWHVDAQGNFYPTFAKPPKGFKELNYFDNGQKMAVWTRDDFAAQWTNSIVEANAGWLGVLRHASGASTLKVMATGAGNPTFGLTKGLMMDVPYSYFGMMRHLDNGKMGSLYPANPYKFSKEMIGNLRKVAKDVIYQKGEFLKMVEEGGLQGTLNMSGATRAHKYNKFTSAAEFINDFGNYLNVRAEYMIRMANREQYIKAGYSSREATAMMRDALDYSQGGQIIKIVDSMMPYTNVAVQSTRKLGKTVLKKSKQYKEQIEKGDGWKLDPDGVVSKVGWLAGTASAIYIAGKTFYPEAIEQESDWNKDNNYIIPTGYKFTDADGDTRWVNIKLKKEPTLAPYMNLGELVAARAMGDEYEFSRILKGFAKSGVPIAKLPSIPIVDVFTTYAYKKDNFSFNDIYYGDPAGTETWNPDRTSKLWKDLGTLLRLEPDTLKSSMEQVLTRNAIPKKFAETTYDALFNQLEQEDQDSLMAEWMLSNWRPGIISVTSELNRYREDIDEAEVEAEGKRRLQERTVDNYARRYKKAVSKDIEESNLESKDEVYKEMIAFFKTQPIDEQRSMFKRFQDYQLSEPLPHHDMWMKFQGIKEPKVRGAQISKWKRTKSFEEQSEIDKQLMWLRVKKVSYIPQSFNTAFWRSYYQAERKADDRTFGKDKKERKK